MMINLIRSSCSYNDQFDTNSSVVCLVTQCKNPQRGCQYKDILTCMNNVIYMNYKKCFAQNKTALDFLYVCLKMVAVDKDESDVVT